MSSRLLFIFFLFILKVNIYAQEDSIKASAKKNNENKIESFKTKIKLVQMLQLWDVATIANSGNSKMDFRNDIYIRRGRTGIKGDIGEDVNFVFIFAYDGIGRDKNTAGNGSQNLDDNRDFYLWDGFLTWNYKPMLNLTAGYFRPQIGRESITAAFKVISLEKSLPNFQLRTHILSRSTGRETGVNLGGLYLADRWSFNYNIGYFDLTSDKIIGTGDIWSPMLASRVSFTLGDPEMDSYKINYVQSFYGKRNGITLGFNATYTGETEVISRNGIYGLDILANYGRWDFNAEYDWLYRNSKIDSVNTNFTIDRVYSIRMGYNFLLKSGKILQASAMYSGQLAEDTSHDSRINAFTKATDQEVFDIGINYLINEDNLKFNLHYAWGKKYQNPNPEYSYIGLGFQILL